MPQPFRAQHWTRHVVYRAEHLRTTWKFRFGVLVLIVAVVWLASSWWREAIPKSLACDANRTASDAIVIENFDADNYLVFERAGELRRAGLASRVLVPVTADSRNGEPNAVAFATAQVVARLARVGDFETIAFREVEPISLNAARDVQRFVERAGIRSIIVVAPYLRSRRSAAVYGATLGRAGIRVTCDPVHGVGGVDTWTDTLHGIQNVAEQWLKLQYYRMYVLPFRLDER
jgi:hypothetical protein